MKFEEALSALKAGKKVRKKSWEDLDYYYEIREIPCGNPKKYIVNSAGSRIELFMDKWILADDWEIVDESKKTKNYMEEAMKECHEKWKKQSKRSFLKYRTMSTASYLISIVIIVVAIIP